MTEHNAEWYFSRGDAELYDKCPRARYNRTIMHGRGVVKIGASFEQSLGRIIHRATEWVLTDRMSLHAASIYAVEATHNLVVGGELPRKIGPEFQEQFLKEAEALAGGLVWAWGLHVLPYILSNYEIVNVENETAYRSDGMVLPTVADVVLRSKDDGSLVYPDWKTAAWVNNAWMMSWNRSAQLHTTARAIEQVLGEEVEHCYVQALVKGRWQNGYQQSPLCWAYHNAETGEWSYKYTARKGWARVPQWTSDKNIEQWVRDMPQDIAMAIVPRTPPIVVDANLADTWWRQRVIKEKKIRLAKEEFDYHGESRVILDSVFPQHFDQCAPVIGFKCDYYDICHDPTIGADPTSSGQFRPRPTYEERCREEGVVPDKYISVVAAKGQP